MKRKNLSRLFAALLCVSFFFFSGCGEEKWETNPYTLGDIILTDGTIVHFADRDTITDEQKKMAAGVVFYVYYSGYDDEITGYLKSSRGKKIKALALGFEHQGSTAWAREHTTGCKMNFTGLQDSKRKVGAGVWPEVYELLKDETLARDDFLYEIDDVFQEKPLYKEDWKISQSGTGVFEENNYPAFYFANNYAEKFKLQDMDFAGDFHIPSIAEFKYISEKLNVVQPSLSAASSSVMARR